MEIYIHKYESNILNVNPYKLNINPYFMSFSSSYIALTLLPMEGAGEDSFLARTIRLTTRTLEPFHLQSPKFLTSFLCPLDTLWQNFR